MEASDIGVVTWNTANNMDARRDVFMAPDVHGNTICGIDGTRKSKKFDNFSRPWPNVIVMDDKTIETVDAKWESLGIGPFLESPSLKFKGQIYGEEAVVS